MIPYGRHDLDDQDIAAVIEVLKSGPLTQGPVVPAFEIEVANFVGARFGCATNSATSALHVACLALGVGVGSRVWTSSNTFVASANCALFCGAQIDFVDIDLDTHNMCMSDLERKLRMAESKGELPDVLIPVHFAGLSCDMRKLACLSQRFGFRVIEDASHALGAKFNDERVGCCRYSDITIFSFHPVKMIACGEGGMALTNDENLIEKMRRLRSHGVTSDQDQLIDYQDQNQWYYQQLNLGYNYRMSDIHGALGLSQLKKLNQFISIRRKKASYYDEVFNEMDDLGIINSHPEGYESSLHLYVIRQKQNGKTSKQMLDFLRGCGITANLHYIPVYLHPYYRGLGFEQGHCLNAELYFRTATTIPLHTQLTPDQQEYVIQQIKNFQAVV